MNDPSRKVTVKQLRTLFPFDAALLAQQAGVTIDTLYHALGSTPIARQDALRILAALSAHTGLALSFEQVQIITWEDFLRLWVIRASVHGSPQAGGEAQDRYHLVYARDWQQAAQLARSWLAQHPEQPYHYFSACPEGLRIDDLVVPGHWQLNMEP
jgi:hypothetical protein